MKKYAAALLLLSLLLSGCGIFNGSYHSVVPHKVQQTGDLPDTVEAENYAQLVQILKELVADGVQTVVIYVENYPEEELEHGLEAAMRMVENQYPIGAYALEEIQWEEGASAGQKAVAVTFRYRYGQNILRKIRHVQDMTQAQQSVSKALQNYDSSILLFIENYQEENFTQYVKHFATDNPQLVMEIPQVTQTNYGAGTSRLVELLFDYQNNRDALLQMREQVKPIYDAAVLYVSGEGSQLQKYSQLYAFLMERFQYSYETSITPAYSLLRHGVGDSRAFATMYAAMCRGAGMECQTITGSFSGEPRIWNRILLEQQYYHVDLLRCNEDGIFQMYGDDEMQGYVWDYSAYPAYGE